MEYSLRREDSYKCKYCFGKVEEKIYISESPVNNKGVFSLRSVAKCQDCTYAFEIFGSLINDRECF